MLVLVLVCDCMILVLDLGLARWVLGLILGPDGHVLDLSLGRVTLLYVLATSVLIVSKLPDLGDVGPISNNSRE